MHSTLHEAVEEIKQYSAESRAVEALPQAHALLRQYPYYWMGFRLLGAAGLERGELDEAIYLYRRVLNIVPDEMGAHAELATAYVESGQLNQALWHLMRAFEKDPGVREIRELLRYLYRERDGFVPGRLPLTRAALAHARLREGRYERAIEEFCAELKQRPDRVDLQVELAVARWQAGQHEVALAEARDVLRELPYSLKANLIVAEYFSRAGNSRIAGPYLQIAQQLDPPNEIAVELFGEEGLLQRRELPLRNMADDPLHTGMMPALDTDEATGFIAAIGPFELPSTWEQEVDEDRGEEWVLNEPEALHARGVRGYASLQPDTAGALEREDAPAPRPTELPPATATLPSDPATSVPPITTVPGDTEPVSCDAMIVAYRSAGRLDRAIRLLRDLIEYESTIRHPRLDADRALLQLLEEEWQQQFEPADEQSAEQTGFLRSVKRWLGFAV